LNSKPEAVVESEEIILLTEDVYPIFSDRYVASRLF